MEDIEMIQYILELKQFMKKHNITCIYDARNLFDTHKMMQQMKMPKDMPLFYWSDKNNIGYNIQQP
jgi:hypothetical protein